MSSPESLAPRRVPRVDLHVHATMRRSETGSVGRNLRNLHRQGLERLWVYANVVAVDPEEYHRRLARLPVPEFHRYGGTDVEDSVHAARAFAASLDDGPRIDVIPMVHAVDAAVEDRLDEILTAGVAAVKLVHDPDLLGEDRHELERQHSELLARLAAAGVPAIVHLDLRHAEAWIRRTLTELPALRLTIAHLGYARSRMGPLLEEFPALLTDIANLAKHMETQPDSYRAFLDRYAGRVVFGSDAFLGDLSGVLRHAMAIERLGLSAAAEDSLLAEDAALLSG